MKRNMIPPLVYFLFFLLGFSIPMVTTVLISNPNYGAKPLPLLLEKGQYSGKTYRYLLTSVPSVNEAFRALKKSAHSEVEVIRLQVLIDMITDAWSLSGGRGSKENEIVKNLMASYWIDYADVIMASNCVYCGQHFYVLRHLTKTLKIPEQFTEKTIRIHPRFLKLVDENQEIDQAIKLKLAKSFSQLSGFGSNNVKNYVIDILNNSNVVGPLETQNLQYSSSRFSIDSYTAMTIQERKNVLKGWENDVANGAVYIQATMALAQTGHRPALRWIIWLQDKKISYLLQYKIKRYRQELHEFITNSTDFSVNQNYTASDYYSDNWQNISWVAAERKWLTH